MFIKRRHENKYFQKNILNTTGVLWAQIVNGRQTRVRTLLTSEENYRVTDERTWALPNRKTVCLDTDAHSSDAVPIVQYFLLYMVNNTGLPIQHTYQPIQMIYLKNWYQWILKYCSVKHRVSSSNRTFTNIFTRTWILLFIFWVMHKLLSF